MELEPAPAGALPGVHQHSDAEAQLPQYSALGMICTILPGSLLSTIDQGVVDVCLVTIAKELETPMHTAQWVMLIYLLVQASTQVVAGRLGDRYSKPRMYQIGVLVFTGSSAGCGFSRSVEALVAMRAIQGLGSALMSTINAYERPAHATLRLQHKQLQA